ncbi:lipid-A-disaccharide synthase [Thermostilla marina]
MRLFFSVGEPSGDQHAAELIRALQSRDPEIITEGYGGPRMAEAGCRLHEDLTERAIMWFRRALGGLSYYVGLYRRAVEHFRRNRPDGVVLVDYPGFNWWMAKAAHREGIPVFYFVPPQIWAWGCGRVKKMRRYVDHVLCCLPFEQPWFAERGCRAVYVGHPFFDEAARTEETTDREDVSLRRDGRPLVVLLPGSRDQEVDANIGDMLQTAVKTAAKVERVRFAVAAFKPSQAARIEARVQDVPVPVEVYSGRTPELIRAADCCLAVSGSVSLELLYHEKPTIILYRISRPAFWVQEQFRKVKYITLVNLLAAKELYPRDLRLYERGRPDCADAVFPEYLTWRDRSDDMAEQLAEWLLDPEARMAVVERLRALKARLDWYGAAGRAAEYILEHAAVGNAVTGNGKPHFVSESETKAVTRR